MAVKSGHWNKGI